jgi:small-conductance mechanosensitive channel
MSQLLDYSFGGNRLGAWVAAAAITVVTAALLWLARLVLARQLGAIARRTPGVFDDALLAAVSAIRGWFVAAIALYGASLVLSLPPNVDTLARRLVVLACLLQAGVSCHRALTAWIARRVRDSGTAGAANPATMYIAGFLARVALWSLVLLMALDNLGFNVTALVAGLGVGGIAVALAVQNILGDIFASLAIALDEPVLIGDFVVIGDLLGTVERVGIKTTRLRSLSGEQIVLANSDLLNSRIRNYKRMQERRVLFRFGVTYDTSPDMLGRIPSMIRTIITARDKARFDRAHFTSFGDSALEFEVVYYVLDADYNVYMDTQQQINMEIVRQFGAANIDFAFPTRTVHIATPEAA